MMNAIKIYEDAMQELESNKITLGEFEQKIEPLKNVRENVRGEWVKLTGMMPPEFHGRHLCSECNGFALHDWKHHKEQLTDFCPNCGADMRAMKTTFKGDSCDLNTTLNNKKDAKKYVLELIKLLKNENRTN